MTSSAAPAPAYTTVRVEFASRHPFFPEGPVADLAIATMHLEGLGVEEVAEAVFEATNAPFEVTGLAGAIRRRFTTFAEGGTFYPSLSVGDVVRLGEAAVRVDSIGFSRA